MTKPSTYYQSLDDLAFHGRNKEYGSYYLRKKYLKYVAWSLVVSIFLILLLVIVPFLLFYFEGVGNELSPEDMYMVDYSFMPNPEEDPSLLLQALAKPREEIEQPVVVEDSIQETDKKEIKEPPVEEEKKENEKAGDSVSAGKNPEGKGTGAGDPEGLYTVIDVYPRFPGGDEARLYFLRKNVRYPDLAIKSGIQGIVLLVFIIEQDGAVSHVEIKRGIGGGCDEEAIRVTKLMPRWDPGKRSGRPVRVLVQMPVVFKIPGR